MTDTITPTTLENSPGHSKAAGGAFSLYPILLDSVLKGLAGLEGRGLGNGASILAPAVGSLPIQAARSLTSGVPKLTNGTLSPTFSALSVAVIKAARADPQSVLEKPLASVIAAVDSVLAIAYALTGCGVIILGSHFAYGVTRPYHMGRESKDQPKTWNALFLTGAWLPYCRK